MFPQEENCSTIIPRSRVDVATVYCDNRQEDGPWSSRCGHLLGLPQRRTQACDANGGSELLGLVRRRRAVRLKAASASYGWRVEDEPCVTMYKREGNPSWEWTSSWFTMMMDMKTSCERVGLDVDAVYRGDGHGHEYVMPMAAVDSKGSRVKDEPCVSSYKRPLRVT
jgi:hypothetical protein